MFYFVDNVVVYKALLVQGKGGKLVYKIFIVNIISYNSDLLKSHGLASPQGLLD